MVPTVKGVGGKKRRGEGKSELGVGEKKTKLKEMHGSWPRRLTCKEAALDIYQVRLGPECVSHTQHKSVGKAKRV